MKPYVHRSGKWVGIGEHCQGCQIFHIIILFIEDSRGGVIRLRITWRDGQTNCMQYHT